MRQYEIDLNCFISSLSRLTGINEDYLREYHYARSLNSLFFDKPPGELTKAQINKLEYLKEFIKLYELETDRQAGFALKSSNKSGSYFADYFRSEENRKYICMALLNSQNEIIVVQNMFEGGLQAVIDHKKEFITRILNHNANSVVLSRFCSGLYENALDDEIVAMRQLKSIVKGIDIGIVDYIVIRSNMSYLSFAESGYMDDTNIRIRMNPQTDMFKETLYSQEMNYEVQQHNSRQRLVSSISRLTGIRSEFLDTYLRKNAVKNIFEVKLPGLTQRQEEKLTLLKEVKNTLPNILRHEVTGDYILNSGESASHYLKNYFSNIVDREYFVVVLLDRQNRIIKTEVSSFGSLKESVVYAREIMKSALYNKASKVILSHNHPGGSVQPSWPDIEVTKKLIHALHQIDVKVQDHIIIAGKHAVSIRSLYHDIFTGEQVTSLNQEGRVLEGSGDAMSGTFLVEWSGSDGKLKAREFRLLNAACRFQESLKATTRNADIWRLSKDKPLWEKIGTDGSILETREIVHGISARDSVYSKNL